MSSNEHLSDEELKEKISSLNKRADAIEHDIKILKDVFSHLQKNFDKFKKEVGKK